MPITYENVFAEIDMRFLDDKWAFISKPGKAYGAPSPLMEESGIFKVSGTCETCARLSSLNTGQIVNEEMDYVLFSETMPDYFKLEWFIPDVLKDYRI